MIRILEKKDFKKYIQLINEFRPIGIKISNNKFNEIYDIIFKNSIIFIMEENNNIIGSSTLIIEQKFIHKLSKYGYIEDVVINEKYRGKGYGQKLIKHLVDFCKKNNFYKITLTCNKKLIPFYKKNNFEVYDIHMSQLLRV